MAGGRGAFILGAFRHSDAVRGLGHVCPASFESLLPRNLDRGDPTISSFPAFWPLSASPTCTWKGNPCPTSSYSDIVVGSAIRPNPGLRSRARWFVLPRCSVTSLFEIFQGQISRIKTDYNTKRSYHIAVALFGTQISIYSPVVCVLAVPMIIGPPSIPSYGSRAVQTSSSTRQSPESASHQQSQPSSPSA